VSPEVSLWKNNTLIDSVNVTNMMRRVQFALEVTADLPGTYQYRAVYYLRGNRRTISSDTFNITGNVLFNSIMGDYLCEQNFTAL